MKTIKRALHWLGFLWTLPFTLIYIIKWYDCLDFLEFNKEHLAFVFLMKGRLHKRMENSRASARAWYSAVYLMRIRQLIPNGKVLAHELTHVKQAQVLGPLFIVLYIACDKLNAMVGLRRYWDNVFEIQAFRASAGRKPLWLWQ